MNFISCRRYLLDKEWDTSSSYLKAPVLDIGGVKTHRRGRFQVPSELKDEWITLNPNPSFSPDIIGSLPSTNLMNESYQTVVLTEVMEYVEDYKSSIREIHRLLKNDGYLIMSVPFMSPLHGDKETDYLRFTETSVKKTVSEYFEITMFKRMGSVLSIGLDAWKANNIKHDLSFTDKLKSKIFRCVGPLAVTLDSKLLKNNEFANTGFWIVAKKKNDR